MIFQCANPIFDVGSLSYNVVVEEKDNGKLHDLNLYWENGIHKDDFIKVKYLPHSKTGIVITICRN